MKMVAVLVCVFADGQKESHENEIVPPFVTNFQGKAAQRVRAQGGTTLLPVFPSFSDRSAVPLERESALKFLCRGANRIAAAMVSNGS
jgi:hypothetical protein